MSKNRMLIGNREPNEDESDRQWGRSYANITSPWFGFKKEIGI